MRFGLEVHPTEIAYDFVTTRKALDAIDRRPAFGINLDPSHFAHQFLDPAAFALEFADRIYHVHVKDSVRRLDGRRSILASHLNFGDEGRGWDFVSPGHGDVDFEAFFRALNRIGYAGPLSVEWEDSGMDREYGAQDALAYVRRTDFPASESPSTRRCSGARTDDGRRDRVRHHGRAAAADEIPEIGVGMLGYAFMGKAHSNAFRTLSVHDVAAAAHATARGDRRARRGRRSTEAARRYGFERATTDWRDLVTDPAIGLFDNGGPNDLHAEPTIAAAEAGKHVVCEKPLGRDADGVFEIWKRSRRRASCTCAPSTTASCRPCGWRDN